MFFEFDFVPGFRNKLNGHSDALEALRRLDERLNDVHLTIREKALIALTVAHVSRNDYVIWANHVSTKEAGLSGEDLVFVAAGSMSDPRESAIVKLARLVTIEGRFHENEMQHLMVHPILSPEEVKQVTTCAAMAVISNYVLNTIAPFSRQYHPL